VPNKPGSTLAAGNRSISLATRTRSLFVMFCCCKIALLDQTVDDVPRLGLARVVDHRIQLMVLNECPNVLTFLLLQLFLRACLAGFLLQKRPLIRVPAVQGGSHDFG
jgi:hypothetical protein